MYEAPWLGFAEIARSRAALGRADYERWRRRALRPLVDDATAARRLRQTR